MSTNWHNKSGKPLSSSSWLLDHHNAKLPERRQFVKDIMSSGIKTVVDIGCGSGLWLELFDEIAPPECKLIGIDSDQNLISEARAKKWSHHVEFHSFDVVKSISSIPNADLFLAFNIFPYLDDPEKFIRNLKNKMTCEGKIIIRQYDGSNLRFGPMRQSDRYEIDTSLYTSVSSSNQFNHYDLDRIHEVIQSVNFENSFIDFELFKRVSPYDDDFFKYYINTINWTKKYISDSAKEKLLEWEHLYLNRHTKNNSYFTEVDLVAILS